jgi:hypothetical protein
MQRANKNEKDVKPINRQRNTENNYVKININVVN